ncbi:MAG: hypothetical protein AB2A00_41450, partial [Myxococcota bacterium]
MSVRVLLVLLVAFLWGGTAWGQAPQSDDTSMFSEEQELAPPSERPDSRLELPRAPTRTASAAQNASVPRLWATPFQRLLILTAATSVFSLAGLVAGGVVGGLGMGALVF